MHGLHRHSQFVAEQQCTAAGGVRQLLSTVMRKTYWMVRVTKQSLSHITKPKVSTSSAVLARLLFVLQLH